MLIKRKVTKAVHEPVEYTTCIRALIGSQDLRNAKRLIERIRFATSIITINTILMSKANTRFSGTLWDSTRSYVRSDFI